MTSGNYYQATRQVALVTQPLDGDCTVDVAIIGGGITGVSAALHLAERGYSVALLEAEEIGWGASGRNGGQALPGFGASQMKQAASDRTKAQSRNTALVARVTASVLTSRSSIMRPTSPCCISEAGGWMRPDNSACARLVS